jgi:hypothetical protein
MGRLLKAIALLDSPGQKSQETAWKFKAIKSSAIQTQDTEIETTGQRATFQALTIMPRLP